MHESTLVGDGAIASNQHIIRNSLSENFDFEDIGDDLFCFPIDVGMHESNVVVTCDDVSEGREALFHPLDGDSVRKRISQMLELLVGCCRWHEKAMSVAYPTAFQRSIQIGLQRGRLPAVNRPIIRVPPMLVCTIGMTSPSSLSNAE